VTEKQLELGAPTFRVHTHGAIAKVPYIPDQSEPARDIVREIPEADTLDTTRDANLQGHHAVTFRSSRLRVFHPTPPRSISPSPSERTFESRGQPETPFDP
jgi:hypothetical protein